MPLARISPATLLMPGAGGEHSPTNHPGAEAVGDRACQRLACRLRQLPSPCRRKRVREMAPRVQAHATHRTQTPPTAIRPDPQPFSPGACDCLPSGASLSASTSFVLSAPRALRGASRMRSALNRAVGSEGEKPLDPPTSTGIPIQIGRWPCFSRSPNHRSRQRPGAPCPPPALGSPHRREP